MHRVKLGNTGIEGSYLSFGTGSATRSDGSAQVRLGFDACVDLLRYGVEQGITSIDTADGYKAHAHVAEVVRTFGRDHLTLTTKTGTRNAEQARQDIPRILEELGTDRIDVLLMHYMTERDWPTSQAPVMDVFSEFKERGIVGAVGVSCHDFGALESAASEDWVDVILARINHDGAEMDGTPPDITDVLQRAHAAGKSVCGMKIMGEGPLASDYRGAILFAYELDCVDAMTIGMESREEVDANVAFIEELHRATPPTGATLSRPQESADSASA
jgi:predicted aldo/keto reductase-like oxidoreductase